MEAVESSRLGSMSQANIEGESSEEQEQVVVLRVLSNLKPKREPQQMKRRITLDTRRKFKYMPPLQTLVPPPPPHNTFPNLELLITRNRAVSFLPCHSKYVIVAEELNSEIDKGNPPQAASIVDEKSILVEVSGAVTLTQLVST
ncbi:hypothetical protein QJS10_CPA06g01445 [Acorus calamus]|uniref:Uncharacterized protein n=1 Tax=Acorus calamus TaxID=4465 RepID=A0AAV9EM77_ACOCL|nr:hypothetical protein QJS10_CPA06g01445 [Acorus calamus]